jgi:hypothetical protein
MNLFVDDERNPEDEYVRDEMAKNGISGYNPSEWKVVRTAQDAIDTLKRGGIDVLSLDHDLGEGPTGYDVIRWIEEQVFINDFKAPDEMVVHSANPVGAKNIKQAISSIKRYNDLV